MSDAEEEEAEVEEVLVGPREDAAWRRGASRMLLLVVDDDPVLLLLAELFDWSGGKSYADDELSKWWSLDDEVEGGEG